MAKKKTTKPAKKTATKTAKRGPGRLPKKTPVVGPEQLQKIADMHLKGKTQREIGTAIGVTHQTVLYHLDTTLRPMWDAELNAALADDMARVRKIEAEAWKRYELDGGKREDLADARWAIEHRAKIAGHFAAQRHVVEVDDASRVAGKSPEQYAQETLDMLVERAGALKASEEGAGAGAETKGRNRK